MPHGEPHDGLTDEELIKLFGGGEPDLSLVTELADPAVLAAGGEVPPPEGVDPASLWAGKTIPGTEADSPTGLVRPTTLPEGWDVTEKTWTESTTDSVGRVREVRKWALAYVRQEERAGFGTIVAQDDAGRRLWLRIDPTSGETLGVIASSLIPESERVVGTPRIVTIGGETFREFTDPATGQVIKRDLVEGVAEIEAARLRRQSDQANFFANLFGQASQLQPAQQAAFADILEKAGVLSREFLEGFPSPVPPLLTGVAGALPTEPGRGAQFRPAGRTAQARTDLLGQLPQALLSQQALGTIGGQQGVTAGTPGVAPTPGLAGVAQRAAPFAALVPGLSPSVLAASAAQGISPLEFARQTGAGPEFTFQSLAEQGDQFGSAGTATVTLPDGTKTTVASPTGAGGLPGAVTNPILRTLAAQGEQPANVGQVTLTRADGTRITQVSPQGVGGGGFTRGFGLTAGVGGAQVSATPTQIPAALTGFDQFADIQDVGLPAAPASPRPTAPLPAALTQPRTGGFTRGVGLTPRVGGPTVSATPRRRKRPTALQGFDF